MFIVFKTLSGDVKIEIFPSVSYKTYCDFLDFPEIEYNSDTQPIVHIVQIVLSLDIIKDEYEISEEIEEQLNRKYWIDKEEDQLIIAKLVMTEFPSVWKEHMDVTWSYWLDALDGDHAVIGIRADEILERGFYDNPFDTGSLYYIQDLDVHDSFKENNIEMQLIEYTFKHFIRNNIGIVFVIPQTAISVESEDLPKIIKDKKSIENYESGGISRVFNSVNKDVIMEIEVHKLKGS